MSVFHKDQISYHDYDEDDHGDPATMLRRTTSFLIHSFFILHHYHSFHLVKRARDLNRLLLVCIMVAYDDVCLLPAFSSSFNAHSFRQHQFNSLVRFLKRIIIISCVSEWLSHFFLCSLSTFIPHFVIIPLPHTHISHYYTCIFLPGSRLLRSFFCRLIFLGFGWSALWSDSNQNGMTILLELFSSHEEKKYCERVQKQRW